MAAAVAPDVQDHVLNVAYRLFPESPAAAHSSPDLPYVGPFVPGLSGNATADVREALPISHGFRRLPIVDGADVVGVLSVDDLLINVAADLGDLVRPITGEIIFGYPEAARTPVAPG